LETLIVEERDGVGTIRLNRPESKNALSPEMADELTATLRRLDVESAVRAVVLTGAGADFCAGGDVKAMASKGPRTTEQRHAAMSRYRDLTLALLGLGKPLVAALDGVAYGAGVSMALAADIVLVSERVRMALVFHRLGLVPDCGAWYTLPRIVCLHRAKELVYSAREFGADEARAMGLALEVLPPAALLPRAQEIAASLGSGPPVAFALSKQALNASLQSDLPAMLDLEAAGQALAGGSEFTREAVRRLVAREPAAFRWPTLHPGSHP
jgi:enoyl-CoA hydratase/carnithine racemase